jgi:hypothetical protein
LFWNTIIKTTCSQSGSIIFQRADASNLGCLPARHACSRCSCTLLLLLGVECCQREYCALRIGCMLRQAENAVLSHLI